MEWDVPSVDEVSMIAEVHPSKGQGISYRGPQHPLHNTPALNSWWRHGMETLSALLALCEGNPLVTGGFPSHKVNNVELLC